MINPRSLENLRPISEKDRSKKGKQRVPIDRALGELDPVKLIKHIIKYAEKGNMKAAEMLLDRYYGKVVQPTDNIHRVDAFKDADPEKIKQAIDNLRNAIKPE